jgi:hypothetical protein
LFALGSNAKVVVCIHGARRALTVAYAAFREAVLALLPRTWQQGTRDRLPFDLVLAVNKMDSLPRSTSHSRIENAVRSRVKQAGLPSPSQVHLVSSVRNMGVRKLLKDIVDKVCDSLSLHLGI